MLNQPLKLFLKHMDAVLLICTHLIYCRKIQCMVAMKVVLLSAQNSLYVCSSFLKIVATGDHIHVYFY
uniref:Uncharacterized protein n=1 Tax=Setaria viridis TaxID=4556 RepID=A0A4U6VX59_SETVI|nr:hypothetical protein SEVIR_2G260001v2 [Setaria viridis]